MIRRPPRSTQSRSSAASDVYKRQAYGYPMVDAFFESVSAGSNTGLSCGVTQASMPTLLKIVYMLEMWMGRLEFLSVFTLFGFIATSFRSMRVRKAAV